MPLTMRENDYNEIEVLGEEGALIEKLDYWNYLHIDSWIKELHELAAKHDIAQVESFGHVITIDDFAVHQKMLADKLRHDRLTDDGGGYAL